MRSLDGVRKGLLIKFLQESSLIDKENLIIPLAGADLSGADLHDANLGSSALINKKRRDPAYFIVQQAGSDFSYVNLSDANLCGTNLRKVLLNGANLNNADLHGADLTQAQLSKTILSEVKNITDEQLASAVTLYQAIMPDGKEYDPNIYSNIVNLEEMQG